MKPLKVEEVAEIFGVTKETVCRWIKFGIIRGNKVGRRWFISQKEVDRVMGGEDDKKI